VKAEVETVLFVARPKVQTGKGTHSVTPTDKRTLFKTGYRLLTAYNK